MSPADDYRISTTNILKAIGVISWLYISYSVIGIWIGFSFGMVSQKLGLIHPGFKELPTASLIVIHFVGFLALIVNTVGMALYWNACRTTLTMIVAALRIPLIVTIGILRRAKAAAIQKHCVIRLFKGGWIQRTVA